jgi:hypothetical protein
MAKSSVSVTIYTLLVLSHHPVESWRMYDAWKSWQPVNPHEVSSRLVSRILCCPLLFGYASHLGTPIIGRLILNIYQKITKICGPIGLQFWPIPILKADPKANMSKAVGALHEMEVHVVHGQWVPWVPWKIIPSGSVESYTTPPCCWLPTHWVSSSLENHWNGKQSHEAAMKRV